jgi:hypothetical protein
MQKGFLLWDNEDDDQRRRTKLKEMAARSGDEWFNGLDASW